MSRFAPRARVIKTQRGWYAILPSGRKRRGADWRNAMKWALSAVEKELQYDEALREARAVDWVVR